MSSSVLNHFSDFSKNSFSAFVRSTSQALGDFDNYAGVFQFSAQTLSSSKLNHTGALSTFEGNISSARRARDLLHTPCVIYRTLTLQAFVETNSDGSFVKKQDTQGVKHIVWRHTCDLINAINLLAARILNLFSYLHKLKAIDIGHHFKNMGYAIMGLFGSMSVLDVAKSVHQYIKLEKKFDDPISQAKEERMRKMRIFHSSIGILSCANEFGLMSGHPAALIAGGVAGVAYNALSLAL